MRCGQGHDFDLHLTPQEFVDTDHFCPTCKAPARRKMLAAGIRAGVVVPGCRVNYPYRDFQLPKKKGPDGRYQPTIIHSERHLRELAAGAHNGDQFEINADIGDPEPSIIS